MDRQSLLQHRIRAHRQEIDFREQSVREESMNAHGLDEDHLNEQSWSSPTSASQIATGNKEQRIAKDYMRAPPWQNAPAQGPRMTIAEFVELKFLPERISQMRYAGRTHYQSMLKHVLTPEEVNRVFQVNSGRSNAKLKAIPGWPYLGNVPLSDVRPEHIERLIVAALEEGYSFQTVMHIRNVVAAVFSHAKKEQCFDGDNPASLVKLSKAASQESGTLTFAQAIEVIRAMGYPEKEMTLFAVCTDMNMVEICGLQWKYVNLTGHELRVNGEVIPPKTIAVRKQWYRGLLGDVAISRVRNLPMSDQMLQMVIRLRNRARFTNPEDFVLTSRPGTPINEANVVARRLKPIAEELQVPSLSWQLFRRTRKALVSEFGMRFQDFVTMILTLVFREEPGVQQMWHCRTLWSRKHSKVL